MNKKLLQSLRKTAAQADAARPTLNNYFNHLMAKAAAEQEQGVRIEAASNNKMPSSASAEGMEERNGGYGHTDEGLDKRQAVGPKTQTVSPVRTTSAGSHITTETDGMPDVSLKSAAQKTAALSFLRQDSLRRQLKAAAAR